MTLAVVLVATLAAESPRPSISVVVRGAELSQQALDAAAPAALLRKVPLPNAAEPRGAPPALPQERIAAARKAYVNADFAQCLEQVADDAALTAALGQQDRANAARVLLWRVACNVGAGKLEPARRSAAQLAAFSLQAPAEVGSVSPEVEAVIARAYQEAGGMRAVPLEVSGTADAAVELDGRPTGCTTPCTLEVLEGSHVVRLLADGHEAVVKLLRVSAPRAALEVELPTAAPELAAAQWSARYRAAPDADGASSVRLLSTALRSARLVMLNVEQASGGRLGAVLAIDGAVTARAERSGDPATELPGLLNDLLVRGQLIEASVPLYRRPLFWVAIAASVAAIAAGVTTFFVLRPVETRVSFQ
ncbi:MAG: PEGA domain-containing protein [Archangiaceae bacterium]|nr:PEGA domain-containing protein [Archangiaceae bacterium]